MKWLLCFSILVFAGGLSAKEVAAGQEARSCGPGYPSDFPCIAGGRPFKGIEGVPNLKSMNVVHYGASPKTIAERLETEAVNSGWVLTKREIGMEPSGPRYRFSFTKTGVTVHVSSYQSHGVTVLQVMTLGANQ